MLHLIDDPDEEVFRTVSDRIMTIGKDIIPNLEHLWEIENNINIQDRIEQLIHKLHFEDLSKEFLNWQSIDGNLLHGAILIARYHYPDINVHTILQEIEKLKRNIWLELNNYLTPIEKIGVVNSILYNYYKLKSVELNHENPEHFMINKVLETKTGNPFGNGLLYLILCDLLDISVRAVNIPNQFLLAYFDERFAGPHHQNKILFYIDPTAGQLYSVKDVANYLKKLNQTEDANYDKPRSSHEIIVFLLRELAKCYNNSSNRYKTLELQELARKLTIE